MLGAPQAKILWSAPSKSRFYYLFWLLELMPGHLRRSILRILVLNPTHEISWSRSGFFLYGDGFCGAVGEKLPEISRNLLALTGKIFRKKRSPNRESLVRGKPHST